MSHAAGLVRFSDGTVKWCEYNGTSDVMLPALFDTQDQLVQNWRKQGWHDCLCVDTHEPVEIYSSYGSGYHWSGQACRSCKLIVKGCNPDDDGCEECRGVPEWAQSFEGASPL